MTNIKMTTYVSSDWRTNNLNMKNMASAKDAKPILNKLFTFASLNGVLLLIDLKIFLSSYKTKITVMPEQTKIPNIAFSKYGVIRKNLALTNIDTNFGDNKTNIITRKNKTSRISFTNPENDFIPINFIATPFNNVI